MPSGAEAEANTDSLLILMGRMNRPRARLIKVAFRGRQLFFYSCSLAEGRGGSFGFVSFQASIMSISHTGRLSRRLDLWVNEALTAVLCL